MQTQFLFIIFLNLLSFSKNMAEGPLSKKIKIEPQPPARPPEGQPEGEAIAVVASRVGPDDLESVTSAFRKKLQRIDFKLDQEKI